MDKDLVLPSGKQAVALELLLGGRPMYGLELVKASNGELLRGSVYVILESLADKGFVTSIAEKTAGVGGLPRRLYSITGLGQRALAARQDAKARIWGEPVSGVPRG